MPSGRILIFILRKRWHKCEAYRLAYKAQSLESLVLVLWLLTVARG